MIRLVLDIPCLPRAVIQIKKTALESELSEAVFVCFVIRLGFEPKTHSLEGCCSIQLSYRTILLKSGAKVESFDDICKF